MLNLIVLFSIFKNRYFYTLVFTYMEIKLNGITLSLDLYGLRTEMIYENKFNKPLDLTNMTTKTIGDLFYCVVLANLEKKKLELVSEEDFLNEIEDNNEGDMTLMKFWVWYVKVKQAQNDLLFKDLDLNEPKKKVTKQ